MPQPWRDQSYNYQLRVPTFAEYVEVANNVSNPKVCMCSPEMVGCTNTLSMIVWKPLQSDDTDANHK